MPVPEKGLLGSVAPPVQQAETIGILCAPFTQNKRSEEGLSLPCKQRDPDLRLLVVSKNRLCDAWIAKITGRAKT